jgi:hypothetical protein
MASRERTTASRGPSAGVRYRADVAEEMEKVDLDSLSEDEKRVVGQVLDVLRKINYGTLLLVVQDGKVVQIEMAEKFRLR